LAPLAVLLTEPAAPSVFAGSFMERMVGFLKLLLDAVFSKLIAIWQISQFDRHLGHPFCRPAARDFSVVCALLTYCIAACRCSRSMFGTASGNLCGTPMRK
jgi:hypothetical protein